MATSQGHAPFELAHGMEGDRMEVKEAAEFLSVTVSQLYRCVRNHSVPHFRVGRLVRFSRRQLMQMTGDNRVGAVA